MLFLYVITVYLYITRVTNLDFFSADISSNRYNNTSSADYVVRLASALEQGSEMARTEGRPSNSDQTEQHHPLRGEVGGGICRRSSSETNLTDVKSFSCCQTTSEVRRRRRSSCHSKPVTPEPRRLVAHLTLTLTSYPSPTLSLTLTLGLQYFFRHPEP